MEGRALAAMNSLPDALSALHDPTTTPAARHAAHVFCEQYKVTAADRLAEILPLIHASQPLLSRHFGLHAVEGVVLSQWEHLSPEAQLELRRSLLSVARDGLLPLAQEAHVVREKLAVLLVGIARREWPARWTTMLPELVQLASAGNTPAHCVLLAMRTLIEDVCSEDGGSWGGGGGGGSNGSASAATDPRSALDVAAPDMLEWMHQRLRYHLSAYQAGPPEAVAEDLLVLRAALSALRAFATHLALGLLLGRASLLAEVVALLNAPVAAVRDEACELLIVLLGKRPKQPAEKLQLLGQARPSPHPSAHASAHASARAGRDLPPRCHCPATALPPPGHRRCHCPATAAAAAHPLAPRSSRQGDSGRPGAAA